MSGELVNLDQSQLATLSNALQTIVATSFFHDRSRPTNHEDRRRVQLCIELFQIMRRDGGWSVQRCIDELPFALRCKLDGHPWDMASRPTWFGEP